MRQFVKLSLLIGFGLALSWLFISQDRGNLIGEVSAANGVITNICGGPNDINGIGKGQGSCGRCTNRNGTAGSCKAQAGEVAVVVECGARLDTNTHNWGIECQGTQLGVHTQTFRAGQTVNIQNYLKDNCIVQIDIFKEGKEFTPTSEGGLVDFIVMYNPNCGGQSRPDPVQPEPAPQPQPQPDPAPNDQPVTNDPPQEGCLPGQVYQRVGQNNNGSYLCECADPEPSSDNDPGAGQSSGRGYSTYSQSLDSCIVLNPPAAESKANCKTDVVGAKCYTDNVSVEGVIMGFEIFVESSQGSTAVCEMAHRTGGTIYSAARYTQLINGQCQTASQVPSLCSGVQPGSKCSPNVSPPAFVEYRENNRDVCECFKTFPGNASNQLEECLDSVKTKFNAGGVPSSTNTNSSSSSTPPTYFTSKEECESIPATVNQCGPGEEPVYVAQPSTNGPNGYICNQQAICAIVNDEKKGLLDSQGYYTLPYSEQDYFYYYREQAKCQQYLGISISTNSGVDVAVSSYSIAGPEFGNLLDFKLIGFNCDYRRADDLNEKCRNDIAYSSSNPKKATCTDIDINDLAIPNMPVVKADTWLENPSYGRLRNCCQESRDNDSGNQIGGAIKRDFGIRAGNCRQYFQDRVRGYYINAAGVCVLEEFTGKNDITEDQLLRMEETGSTPHLYVDPVNNNVRPIVVYREDLPTCTPPHAQLPLPKLLKAAQAQTTTANQDNQLLANQSGRYSLNLGESSIAELELVVEGSELEIKPFHDLNGNGLKDLNEEYLSGAELSSYRLGLVKDTSVKEYTINSGWNLVHIPLVDNRDDAAVKSAKALMTHWNKQGTDIVHIASFNDGRFNIYSQRNNGQNFAPDFYLIPGQAVFVFNAGDARKVTFSGKALADAAPLQLVNGWNLIGLAAPSKEYNSEALLKALQGEKITANSISQFENGQYRTVVLEDNLVYGNNYPLTETRGYFIKVDANAKLFNPQP